MSESMVKPPDLAPISDAVGMLEKAAPAATGQNSERHETAGEIAVERGIFTGIGFVVNEASAIVLGDQFKDGENLLKNKPLGNSVGKWLSKEGFDDITKKMVDSKLFKTSKGASRMLLTATLLTTGTMLVWPMKALKDNEQYLVKKANHFFDKWKGNKLTDEQVAARDKDVEDALAKKPKQSWPSLLIGRTAAVASTMANSYVMGEHLNTAGHISENLLMKGKFSKDRIGKEGDPKSRWSRWANLAGIETICCTISSLVLEGTAKLTSPFFDKPKPKLNDLPAAAPVSATGSADTDTQLRALENPKKARANENLADQYKKKPPQPSASHVDLARQTGEPLLSAR